MKTAEDLTIWNLVHDWCNGLTVQIPDMAKRYLMDKIESYAKEHAIETALQYYKWTKFGKHNDIILREHIEQWYADWIN